MASSSSHLQRQGSSRRGRPPIQIDVAAVQSMFDRPQPAAALCLGISLTSLKLVCRKLGLVRWPYRRRDNVKRRASKEEAEALAGEHNALARPASSDSTDNAHSISYILSSTASLQSDVAKVVRPIALKAFQPVTGSPLSVPLSSLTALTTAQAVPKPAALLPDTCPRMEYHLGVPDTQFSQHSIHGVSSTHDFDGTDESANCREVLLERKDSGRQRVINGEATHARQPKTAETQARGPPLRGRPPVQVDLACLKAKFNYPHVTISQPAAAKELGISLTTLKQLCRRLGLLRWPYRRTAVGVGAGAANSDSDDDAKSDTRLVSSSPPAAPAAINFLPRLQLPVGSIGGQLQLGQVQNQGCPLSAAQNIVALQNSIAALKAAIAAGGGGDAGAGAARRRDVVANNDLPPFGQFYPQPWFRA